MVLGSFAGRDHLRGRTGLLESDLLDASKRRKHTFGCPKSHLLSKRGFSSSFHLAQGSSKGLLEVRQIFLETHYRFVLNFMISSDMVIDNVLLYQLVEFSEL